MAFIGNSLQWSDLRLHGCIVNGVLGNKNGALDDGTWSNFSCGTVGSLMVMVRVTVIGKLVILIYEENQIDKNIVILFAIFGNVGMVQTNNQ